MFYINNMKTDFYLRLIEQDAFPLGIEDCYYLINTWLPKPMELDSWCTSLKKGVFCLEAF